MDIELNMRAVVQWYMPGVEIGWSWLLPDHYPHDFHLFYRLDAEKKSFFLIKSIVRKIRKKNFLTVLYKCPLKLILFFVVNNLSNLKWLSFLSLRGCVSM